MRRGTYAMRTTMMPRQRPDPARFAVYHRRDGWATGIPGASLGGPKAEDYPRVKLLLFFLSIRIWERVENERVLTAFERAMRYFQWLAFRRGRAGDGWSGVDFG